MRRRAQRPQPSHTPRQGPGAIGAGRRGGGLGGPAIAPSEAGPPTEVARAVATAFAAAGFREPEFLIALAGPPAGRVHTGEER